MNKHTQRHKTLPERFWEKVNQPSEGCWDWKSAVGTRGYGIFWVGGSMRNEMAHRVAYELANAEQIPDGLVVMHSCDNPRCCNPAHLSLGTPKDNTHDAVRKRRHVFGERNKGGNKLTAEQARQIRWHMDGLSVTKPAARYGVSTNTIKQIQRGRLWAHIAD